MALGYKVNGVALDTVYQSYQDIGLVGANSLWSWGSPQNGELGTGNRFDPGPVTQYQVGDTFSWSTVGAGWRHSAATKTDGTLWTWGLNSYSTLGLNDTTDRSSPVQVGTLTNWSKIAAGTLFMAAIKTDGTLWTWGKNTNGQLGDGTSGTATLSPVQVGSLTNWSKIAVKNNHAMAIKTDGTLWTWGKNNQGQLGLNTVANGVSSPTQVGSLTDWHLVDSGYYHMVAIKSNGTLWTWGQNTYGQLGYGTTVTSTSSPVQLGTSTDWKSIACDANFSTYAIKTNGTLWTWGKNTNGQLGLGDTTNRSSPIQVGSLTNWNSVYGGSDKFYAIKTDGSLWTCGYSGGTLGLGDYTDRSSPVQVGSLTNWSVVSGGYLHALGLYTAPYKAIP